MPGSPHCLLGIGVPGVEQGGEVTSGSHCPKPQERAAGQTPESPCVPTEPVCRRALEALVAPISTGRMSGGLGSGRGLGRQAVSGTEA